MSRKALAREGPAEESHAALRWGIALAVFALSLAPFVPALFQGFVALDDDYNFERNEAYRGLGLENLRWMFGESYMGHYQPLSWLTLALDYQLWGLNGAGYHATNMLLHGCGMLALYGLALALLRPRFPGLSDARVRVAAAGAALFHAVHPLRVESVAWATERRDVQAGLFLILALWTYVVWAQSGGERRALLWLSFLAYVVSLFSKAWGITLPAVLLVLDFWPLGRRVRGKRWSRLVGEKWIYAAPAVLVAVLALRAQGAAGARETLADHTLLERCVQASYGLAFYAWKTLWPGALAALYWLEMEVDPLRPAHLASYAAVAVLTLALWAARRRFPAGLAAWVVYAVAVSPVLGFVQSGFQKVADRYSYLACVPFALLFGAGLAALFQRPARRGPASAAAVVWLAALGALAWRQTLFWKDSETLYERVVAVEPGNYFAWHNLAVQYQIAGRHEEALAAERRSIEHHPGQGNLPARVNLAHLLEMLGRRGEALDGWRAILEVDPAHAEALRSLKNERLRSGDVEGAAALIEAALERAPESVDAYAELAGLYARQERPAEALAVWERAARAAPASARARHGVGAALLELDRDEDAGPWLEQAFHMDNHDVEIAVDYARALGRTGHAPEARDLLRQVLIAAPGHARALAAQRALEGGARP